MPDDTPAPTEISGPLAGVVKGALRRAVRGQRGAAREYVAGIRRKHPQESPARLRRRLDSRYLLAVSTSGAAVGTTAAVPGVGTVVGMGAIGAESLAFLEATAFYTLAVAEVQGVDVGRQEHEEQLVLTILLGASGTAILSRSVTVEGRSTGSAATGRALQLPGVRELNRRMATRFLRRFAVKRATLAMGKLAPAGIGAAVGAWGNRRLGRSVVETAHASFGAPPEDWPET